LKHEVLFARAVPANVYYELGISENPTKTGVVLAQNADANCEILNRLMEEPDNYQSFMTKEVNLNLVEVDRKSRGSSAG